MFNTYTDPILPFLSIRIWNGIIHLNIIWTDDFIISCHVLRIII